MRLSLISQVIITQDIPATVKRLESLATQEQFVKILKEESFLVEDVKLAIEKAYLASQEQTILLLGAKLFSEVVQNRLLKVIEEPPKNKRFILLTPSKATILPTIRSRLPITVVDDMVADEVLGLELSTLSLETLYAFVQTHKRTDSTTMKRIVEQIVKSALYSQKYHLSAQTLQLCSDSFEALDRGSPPQFVLTALLLKLLTQQKR